ncbi:putative ribonuclease H-like domain-containing protein [Tanacetum coccineum]
MTHPHLKRIFVPKAVLMKSGLKTLNTARQNSSRVAISVNIARPINTAYPRSTVNNERPVGNVTIAGPKAVVSDNKGNEANAVKASTCWVWRPKKKVLDHVSRHNGASMNFKRFDYIDQDLKDKGVIDSGCSRHMTVNKSYLTNYEEIDRGFVAFGGCSKGGKITGKGKIRTGKLNFKDVYFVKELKFNLFSVSQMCDKKNSVLFTDTKCVVLSPDFKLTDESHVLLKVPRKDNMYSIDLKNVFPQGGLTCLLAKATPDESNLWHMRLGYVNFKTLNKLVRGNLVRGLPSKLFENNQTCVACQKGKQHRASYKTKTISSISQPLQMLHMDLFGPTFVKSLMKKMYCLVVTDDFSRNLHVYHMYIFEQLAIMGYEKPSQKLTFYKAFFSPQWKFFIHTILQCLSAKSTTWNEFSSTMASVIICLDINQKFNFSKYIFESMVKNVDSSVKFLMYPRFVQVFLESKADDSQITKRIYVSPSYTKKVFGNMKRGGKGFSERVTPLFPAMMVQAQQEIGEGLAIPIDPHHTPIITQPSTSKPQKKQKLRKPKRKDTEILQSSGLTEPIADAAANEENIPTHSNNPLLSGFFELETYRRHSALEIESLKRRVNKLEKKQRSRTHKLKKTIQRLVETAQVCFLLKDEGEDVVEKEVSTADPVTTTGEVVTTVVLKFVFATTTTTTAITEFDLTLALKDLDKLRVHN